MHTEKQVKDTLSLRIFRQAKERGVQQFRLEDNRENAVSFEKSLLNIEDNRTLDSSKSNHYFILNNDRKSTICKQNIVFQRNTGEGLFIKKYDGCTRHHIIPEEKLNTFYDKAKKVLSSMKDKSAYYKMKGLLFKQYYNIKKSTHKSNKEKELSISTSDDIFNAWLKDVSPSYYETLGTELKEITIWFPANLVLGPVSERRAEDPGSNIDMEALSLSTNKNKAYFVPVYSNIIKFNKLDQLVDLKELEEEIILISECRDQILKDYNEARAKELSYDSSQKTNPFSILNKPDDLEQLNSELQNRNKELKDKRDEYKTIKRNTQKRILEIVTIVDGLTKIVDGGDMTDARLQKWKMKT